MNHNLNMTLWTSQKPRSSASTGARVSPGKFSPTSPKGGFGSTAYEGVRYLDERYGYNVEKYFKTRLFGHEPGDFRWRYDLNKRLIGRPDYRTQYVPSWLPRFPKKKFWSETNNKDIQENTQLQKREFWSWIYQSTDNSRGRRSRYPTNKQYRWPGTYWLHIQIRGTTILRYQRSRHPMLHKLYNPVQTRRSKFY